MPTPHAPCCQESSSRSTWDALALRATSRCLFTPPIPEWQKNTFVGAGIGAGVCPLNSGLAFTLQTGRHLMFGGSLVSWFAQVDHCGMITCERCVPTPHAPCCPESSSRSTWDALALRATSRCLFTPPIPERPDWRHF